MPVRGFQQLDGKREESDGTCMKDNFLFYKNDWHLVSSRITPASTTSSTRNQDLLSRYTFFSPLAFHSLNKQHNLIHSPTNHTAKVHNLYITHQFSPSLTPTQPLNVKHPSIYPRIRNKKSTFSQPNYTPLHPSIHPFTQPNPSITTHPSSHTRTHYPPTSNIYNIKDKKFSKSNERQEQPAYL